MLDVSVYNSLSESKFRGPPSPDLDAAWNSIANQDQYIMRMDKHDLLRINRSDAKDTAFGWEGDSDGIRMIPEVFHELHCLVSFQIHFPAIRSGYIFENVELTDCSTTQNTLRKFTWPDHYQLVPEQFKDDPVYIELYKRDHIGRLSYKRHPSSDICLLSHGF